MDMNRNAIWRNPENVPHEGIERMNRFWGDYSWKEAAYAESPQQNLFYPPDLLKQSNEAIAAAFGKRLKELAGFSFIPDPLPMRNSNNAVVYYLFLARPRPLRRKSPPTSLTNIASRQATVTIEQHEGDLPRQQQSLTEQPRGLRHHQL